MSLTSYLGLNVYNTVTNGSVTFPAYVEAISGSVVSNMTIIDNFANDISASMVSLQSVNYCDCARTSGNAFAASVAGITSYLVGMVIVASFDYANSGAMTLDINGLGVTTIKKLNTSAILDDLASGDIKANKRYIFTYDGTYFVWTAATSGDQISMSGTEGNLVYISDGLLYDSTYGFGGEFGVAVLGSGSIATDNLGTGTASASSILFGDQTWKRLTDLPMWGFFGASPIVQPTVVGSVSGSEAISNLLVALANLGLIVNSTGS
jgi:hypothetical protein